MQKNILITGAARRIGASCARLLHAEGYNICLHYRNSEQDVIRLHDELNQKKENSARMIQADLLSPQELQKLAQSAVNTWGGIDGLVNNASTFYPGDIETVTETDWNNLLGSNLKAPFFLVQALLPTLKQRTGCIVNIIDIHAERSLKGYPVYSIAKSGLAAMTRSLAKELGPHIRVNGVAPGAILWPEQDLDEESKSEILQKIPLQRTGAPLDIAKAVLFLIKDAGYITGQIVNVDGGRTLFS